MNAPTSNDLVTMNYSLYGLPFVRAATQGVPTYTLDFPLYGLPFIAPDQNRRRVILVE